MNIFFHGWCYNGFNRFLLIFDKEIHFIILERDTDFKVDETISSKYKCNIFRFESSIEQWRNIHSKLRFKNSKILLYSAHDILNVSWIHTQKINRFSTTPAWLLDINIIIYEYFKFYDLEYNDIDINDLDMDSFCYDYSFCDDI